MNDNFNFEELYRDSIMNNSYWNKYNNLIKTMSSEQRVFVSKQQSVLEAKQNLVSTFIDYLFEKEKNSFINSSEEAKRISDFYIDAVKEAADKYVTRNEELEKENADLKKQLKQLLLDFEDKKQNAKNQNSTK